MFKAEGQIINLFTSPPTEKYDESFKVQLLGDMPTKDGQVRKEMVTLNVTNAIYNSLQGHIGQTVSIPVGFYVNNGRLTTFFPKSAGDKINLQPAGIEA